jgi:hypothetical protein
MMESREKSPSSEGMRPKSTEKRVKITKEAKKELDDVPASGEVVAPARKVVAKKTAEPSVEAETAPKKTTRKKVVKEADDAKSE